MKSDFFAGVRVGLPIVVTFIPFGLLYGAVAVDNGLTVFEATLASAVMFAGASQLVGIELFGQKVAPWLIIFSIFAVNFRHVLYSAAVGRRIRRFTVVQKIIAFFFLADPQFAETERRGGLGKPITFAWYMGLGVTNYSCWVLLAFFGAQFGKLIPDPHAFGLDFLLPIYFLGLLMGFHKRPMWLPVVLVSGVAAIVAWTYVGSPWHVSLGALAGILVAVLAPVRKPAEESEEVA